MSKKDYYEVLEISKSADASEIKKAYLKLAKKYHPDQNAGDPNAEKKFKEISEAYDVLKDEQKRAAYDKFGHSAFAQGNSASSGFGGGGGGSRGGFNAHFNTHDINDIFGDFFGDFMGGNGAGSRGRSSSQRGSDLKYNISITLEEAFAGVDKNINFATQVKCAPCDGKGTKEATATVNCSQCGGSGAIRMQQGFFAIEQTCNKCGGSGKIIKNPCSTCQGGGRASKQKSLIVKIPAGIEDQNRIRIAGEGEAGVRGGASGDLYVFVSIKPHDIYKVENSNLHFKLPINVTKAALGCEIEVPTIDGSTVVLKIPAGSETGDQLRLKNNGMSKIQSTVRGDLYAHIFVQTPKNLTKRQKELLEDLDKELGEVKGNFSESGFFSKMKNLWS